MRTASAALFLAALGLCAAVPAYASTTANQVKIMRCDLEVKGGRAGGFSASSAYSGYRSGAAPTAPYYWGDPFGNTYYQPPTSGSANLFIDFKNVTDKTMKAIDFGADVRGVVIAQARDTGSFAPNAEIKRKYGVDPLAVPKPGVKLTCLALKVEFADGTTWTDPHLPPPSKTLYEDKP